MLGHVCHEEEDGGVMWVMTRGGRSGHVCHEEDGAKFMKITDNWRWLGLWIRRTKLVDRWVTSWVSPAVVGGSWRTAAAVPQMKTILGRADDNDWLMRHKNVSVKTLKMNVTVPWPVGDRWRWTRSVAQLWRTEFMMQNEHMSGELEERMIRSDSVHIEMRNSESSIYWLISFYEGGGERTPGISGLTDHQRRTFTPKERKEDDILVINLPDHLHHH